MPSSYIKKILEARVYDISIETPVEKMEVMSEKLTNEILIKREDLQPVFSFKLRGAYNKIVNLTDKEKSNGVIAASAGNHAQGVALSANKLGIKSIIVMPQTTPNIKVESVKRFGGEVILNGDSFDEAYGHAQKLKKENGYTFIHPYDDPDVIAGQGTIGMEICRQVNKKIDVLFLPVGGGGLAAGVAAYVKYLRPETKIIAVEASESACLDAAIKNNERVILKQVGIFADGVAVKQIGEKTFELLKDLIDDVITVSTDEICTAIKEIFEDTRTLSEPAGALSLAGLKKYVRQNNIKGQTLLNIESGANVNFDRLRHISERTEIGENAEMILGVTIPERPGSFKIFCEALGNNSITEFNYRYADQNDAQVFVGIKISPNSEEREEIMKRLIRLGYSVIDMSKNELAKLHVRYMVGGRARHINFEKILRFEFPERPGALLQLLNEMGERWNISMFHYRNHGAGFGRVFIGIQVPSTDSELFARFLKDLKYRYFDETDNPAYDMFL